MNNSKIPSWLFFALLPSLKIKDWSEEKEQTAQRIIKRLTEKAEIYSINIEPLLKYEKYDSVRGYMADERLWHNGKMLE